MKLKTYHAAQLIHDIETEFASVKFVEKTLEQCFITDKYGMSNISTEDFERKYYEAGRNRVDSHWSEIPDAQILKHDCPFCNMSNAEFAYYLPAYMRYVLKNHQVEWWQCKVLNSVLWYLGRNKEYEKFQYLFDEFNDAQKKTIMEFVIFVVDLSYGKFEWNAENKFWNEYYLESTLKAKNHLYSHFGTLLDN